MERDYHYPSLADREQPKTWEDAGAQTAMDRARQRVDTILDTHKPAYLSDRQDAEIRAAFPIID
jgi:trimethylamine--corrinoid protein Co-methyltransferase